MLESFLRLTGLGVPSSYQDPFVGFSQIYPLFELDSQKREYRTARHHHYFFGIQSFPSPKQPDTFRAFCLGGSTILGHPYETETAIPKWMEIELSGRDSSRDYEIINCGGMSYASYRLIPILEEVLGYQPDLVVIMTGHNEFLEDRTYRAVKDRPPARAWIEDRLFSLRTVTLGRRAWDSLNTNPAGPSGKTVLGQRVDARLDHASGYASYQRDELWHRGVARHYALNVRVMVRLCQEAGVPLLLIKPGANLRDCPPFKSENALTITPEQREQWERSFERAAAVETSNPATALEGYRQAADIDDLHAELIYRMARCLDRLERYDEARASYVRAKELDVCPLRIRTAMQESLLEIAESTSTPVVDAARLIENQTEHALVGFDWYVDQVHPSIRGQQLIAQAIVKKLQDAELIDLPLRDWSPPERRLAYRRHIVTLGREYFASGRRRVEWLEDWARRDRLRYDSVGLDVRANLDLGHTFLEFGEFDLALAPYRTALKQDPASASPILERALQLFRSGRNATAERALRILLPLELDPQSANRARAALSVLSIDAGGNDTFPRPDEIHLDVHGEGFLRNWLAELLPDQESVE